MCQHSIANIDINKDYDESLGTEEVHYQSFSRMAAFFGRDMQAHRHDRYFQMHYLDTGQIELQLDDHRYSVQAPLFVITPPSVPHAFITESDSDGHVLTVHEELIWPLLEVLYPGTRETFGLPGICLSLADKPDELAALAKRTTLFARLAPLHKERIVTLLKREGHVVGFMGDGINDAAAMKAADIGISVDTAVDVAKESADIILLEKDLMVLEQGIIEGRKTYANMIKYIKMTASSNFGNMFSVLAASALLPFLPMMSVHLIFLNLIYDLSCTAIPWDNVDEEFISKPRKWDASSVGNFMLWLGPTSSIFAPK